MSAPCRVIHSPAGGACANVTPPSAGFAISCITMVSAPGGTVAPVNTRAAVPAASGFAACPAGTRCDTGSVTP
jgi:hypothetical protein